MTLDLVSLNSVSLGWERCHFKYYKFSRKETEEVLGGTQRYTLYQVKGEYVRADLWVEVGIGRGALYRKLQNC